jgi:recombination protein RecA
MANASEDKKKALSAALGQIEKQFGKGSVMRMGDAGAMPDIESVSTGPCQTLNQFLPVPWG